MGRRPNTPENGKCFHCQGSLEPDTDGNGSNVDRCTKCGTLHVPKSGSHVPSPTEAVTAEPKRSRGATPAKAPKAEKQKKKKKKKKKAAKKRRTSTRRPRAPRIAPCDVEGCPGVVVDGADCSCCEKRQAFRDANGRYRCVVCHGEFDSAEASKTCEACRPLEDLAA